MGYVAGYVTNVGRTNHLKSGSRNLDFHLANHRGQSIRVTLWGSLGDVLIEKKTKQTGVCPVILSATCPKKYNNKVYLSSTSSTVIYDDDAIPTIKALKKANRTSVDLSQPRAVTLKNLLMWARNRNNDSITFHCKVIIDGIRTMNGWNFPLCGSDTCKKALTRQDGQFFCQSCNKAVDYPVLRYRLEVDVSDNTAQAVVVMFNETATALVNCYADSLRDTVDKDPSIVTPSKLVEERKKSRMDIEDSETEDSSDSANAKGQKGVVEPSAKKRKNCRPLKLWEENWVKLLEDILNKKRKQYRYPELNLSDEQVRNYCLLEIQDLLNTHGKSLSDFKDLPQSDPNLLTNLDNRLLKEALSFDANKSKVEHEKLHSMLNHEQRLIYEQIIESVHNDKGQFCFIHGPEGIGKTFLYKTIIARLRSEQMTVHCVTVTTSRFVIPLELMENSTCGIKQGTHLTELLQHVRLIIWDEAPMTQRYAFEALHKTLQDILGYQNQARRNRIFGGMTVLLGGDFRQTLVFTLTRSMRVNEYACNGEIDNRKQDFNRWVLAVGDGRLPAKKKESEDEPTWIEIPEEFLIKSWTSPIEQIVVETYLDFTSRQGDDEYLTERAILTPRNDDADAINEHMFKKLGGAPVTYNSADEICKASTDTADQHDLYPVEFLNSLNFQGIPPMPSA
ncbi:ATP-dependent DNA helicase PIF1-like protein [Tanacetum coccineum]